MQQIVEKGDMCVSAGSFYIIGAEISLLLVLFSLFFGIIPLFWLVFFKKVLGIILFSFEFCNQRYTFFSDLHCNGYAYCDGL